MPSRQGREGVVRLMQGDRVLTSPRPGTQGIYQHQRGGQDRPRIVLCPGRRRKKFKLEREGGKGEFKKKRTRHQSKKIPKRG